MQREAGSQRYYLFIGGKFAKDFVISGALGEFQ